MYNFHYGNDSEPRDHKTDNPIGLKSNDNDWQCHTVNIRLMINIPSIQLNMASTIW